MESDRPTYGVAEMSEDKRIPIENIITARALANDLEQVLRVKTYHRDSLELVEEFYTLGDLFRESTVHLDAKQWREIGRLAGFFTEEMRQLFVKHRVAESKIKAIVRELRDSDLSRI
jgi:hypothetical protein